MYYSVSKCTCRSVKAGGVLCDTHKVIATSRFILFSEVIEDQEHTEDGKDLHGLKHLKLALGYNLSACLTCVYNSHIVYSRWWFNYFHSASLRAHHLLEGNVCLNKYSIPVHTPMYLYISNYMYQGCTITTVTTTYHNARRTAHY